MRNDPNDEQPVSWWGVFIFGHHCSTACACKKCPWTQKKKKRRGVRRKHGCFEADILLTYLLASFILRLNKTSLDEDVSLANCFHVTAGTDCFFCVFFFLWFVPSRYLLLVMCLMLTVDFQAVWSVFVSNFWNPGSELDVALLQLGWKLETSCHQCTWPVFHVTASHGFFK